jgi:hypothetical protein
MSLSSCTPIGSIQRDCRDSVPGIREIKIKVSPSVATLAANYTVTSGTVTIASGSQDGWYTYYIERGTAFADETGTSDRANGTTQYKQAVQIIFNKLSVALRNEIEVLAKNDIQVAVRDSNDNYRLYGYEYGMFTATTKGSTGVSGSTDRNGYEINLEADERVPAPYMSSATYALLHT